MKNSIFRALCAIAVGVLLVKYRQEMVQWMTVTIGILFLLSGIVAIAMSFGAKRAGRKKNTTDSDDDSITELQHGQPSPSSSYGAWGWGLFAGTGSIVFGLVLALMPGTFVDFLVYILSAILIIGAAQQFFTLTFAYRFAHIGFIYWVIPALLLVAGIVAIAYPKLIASAPLLFIGWCMIFYGLIDFFNALKLYNCQKAAERAHAISNGKPNFADAETVDYEETEKKE